MRPILIALLALATIISCTVPNPNYDPRYEHDGGFGVGYSDSGLGEDATPTGDAGITPDATPSQEATPTPPGFNTAPVTATVSSLVGGDSTPCNLNGVLVKGDGIYTGLDHEPEHTYGLINVGGTAPPIETADCVEADFGKVQRVRKIIVWASQTQRACGFACGNDPGTGYACGRASEMIIATRTGSQWNHTIDYRVNSTTDTGYELFLVSGNVRYVTVCRGTDSPYRDDIRVDFIEAVPPS